MRHIERERHIERDKETCNYCSSEKNTDALVPVCVWAGGSVGVSTKLVLSLY